ncbi:MAG: hypothetical protein DELT_00980 [Desulfovibrio sp.]
MTDLFTFILSPETSSFWEVQRSFLEGKFDFQTLQEGLLLVGIIVGVLVAVMLVLHLRPKKAYVPQDWILEPDQIKSTLSIALSQRAKFELQFTHDESVRRPALRCSAYELDSRGVTLEASGLTALSRRWIGKRVDCFFMLRRREHLLFYAFSSTIVDLSTSNNICFIKVGIPEQIEARQKRSYLRIVPPDEFMLGAAVWRGLDMPKDVERADLALWPKPSFIWLPGTREDFTIRDISSGGMRLHLPRHTLAEETDLIHISTQFVVMLDLWDPDKAQRLRFWVLCRMQSPVLDFETKGMDLGAQFLAWAKPARNGDSALLWLKLASSGEVEPLGNWIMRRHLEFFRENEQNAVITARDAAQEDG